VTHFASPEVPLDAPAKTCIRRINFFSVQQISDRLWRKTSAVEISVNDA